MRTEGENPPVWSCICDKARRNAVSLIRKILFLLNDLLKLIGLNHIFIIYQPDGSFTIKENSVL